MTDDLRRKAEEYERDQPRGQRIELRFYSPMQLRAAFAAGAADTDAECIAVLREARGYVFEYACDNPNHPLIARIDAILGANKGVQS